LSDISTTIACFLSYITRQHCKVHTLMLVLWFAKFIAVNLAWRHGYYRAEARYILQSYVTFPLKSSVCRDL